MRSLVLAFCFTTFACLPAFAAPDPVVAADHAAVPAAAATTTPSQALHNPASEPLQSWSDALAAKKIGWTALVFALVTMLAMGVGTLGKNIAKLAWMNRGRAAVILGGVAAVGAAGFDVAMQGGSPLALFLAVWTAGLAFYQRSTPLSQQPKA